MPNDESIDVSPVGYSDETEPDVTNVTEVDEVTGVSSGESSGQSVVGITRLFECTEEYYNDKVLDPDEFFEYTLYLVNRGTSIDDSSTQNTDLYFGSRKLTDFLVVSEYPGNTDYPNDKIYLVPRIESNVVVGYSVYFKSNDIVVPIQTNAISSISYDEDYNIVQVVFTTNEGDVVPANLLLVDDDGSLFPENVQQIADAITDTVVAQVEHDLTLYWDYI